MEYSIKPKRLGERRIIHYPQKRIIGLYVNNDMETRELAVLSQIAEILSENVNTVKTRLYAALDKLKKNMGKDVEINEKSF